MYAILSMFSSIVFKPYHFNEDPAKLMILFSINVDDSVLQLQPHFQLDQMISSIKLITELSPHHKIKE